MTKVDYASMSAAITLAETPEDALDVLRGLLLFDPDHARADLSNIWADLWWGALSVSARSVRP